MPLVTPIGVVRSPWSDRFGIPRQPGLIPSAVATIELDPSVPPAALKGLEGFSHLWVIFLFHGVAEARSRWTVRPPRLGGNRRVGVFASRSPHRPNGIGMSVVSIDSVDAEARRITVSGHDLLDGTPVLDLKPYLPYADALPHATSGWAGEPIPRLTVTYAPAPAAFLAAHPALEPLITGTLTLDPRPAAKRWGQFVVRVGALDVRATVEDDRCEVTEIWPWEAP